MTLQPQSPVEPNQYPLLPQKFIDKKFNTRFRSSTPLNSTLPIRKSVLTYLHHLDRCWRGGWSWQWPLIIAGPADGGKTQLAYQLMASSLLSFPAPWRISYSDLAGDYRPERIQKILGWRKQGSPKQYQLGRVEKNTLYHKNDLYDMMEWNVNRPDLALWVIDAMEHLDFDRSILLNLQFLIEFGRRRNCGIIVTIRGDLDTIRPFIPWSLVPYFLYITPKRHRLFHLRVWQSGGSKQNSLNSNNSNNSINSLYHKIYDRFLNFYGYFQEVRWWDEKEKPEKSRSSNSSKNSKKSKKSKILYKTKKSDQR